MGIQPYAYSYLLLEAVEQAADKASAGQLKVSLGQVVAHHKREAHRAQAEVGLSSSSKWRSS